MYLQTLFNIISLAALTVIGGALAQDDGPGFVTKCVQPGHVALTFDDGPSPFTPKLLEHLSAAKVPATFFVLGVSINEDGGKENLKAAFDAGHQIALHSNTHADMNTKTPDEILSEYTINLKAVVDTIGVSPAMARPPFGNCNAACAKVLEGQMNLTVIQWSCDSNDWQYDGNVADQPKLFTNMETIIDKSNSGTDSFITLQHDIKDYSVAYVPKIIDMIRGKGYTFVTVEQCINKAAYVGEVVALDPAAAPATPTTTDIYTIQTAPADPSPAAAEISPAADPSPAAAEPAHTNTPGAGTSNPTAANASDSTAANASNPTAANAKRPTPATSSADKFTFTFGLKLIGLIVGILMY